MKKVAILLSGMAYHTLETLVMESKGKGNNKSAVI